MADAAVEFLLENLKQLLLYNASLILDIKDQVEFLYNDLCLFKAFLKDSTEKRRSNQILKELVKQIRDVVYEAEDAIDTFVATKAHHKARKVIEKMIHILDYNATLRQLAKKIEKIRAKVKDIYDNKKFGFEALTDPDGAGKGTKEKKPPIVEEDNVVGFEDEATKVIGLLKGGSDGLEVISIVGMPGLGKTTLAKMVYRDPRTEFEFYRRAWVYVSQEYSRKEVFLNILGHFTQITDAINKMTDEMLAKKLYEELGKGKYLIVMDDVWTEAAWTDLKVAFPKNNKGSRILITSRIKNVGKHANPNRDPHDLRFLTNDESWRLLQRKALGEENCPEELVQYGKRIANECGGLPLAIVVIGGILLEKGPDWWETVANKVDAYIAMGQDRRMNEFISLSYNHLPYHLKSCFIYFGMFPEDFEIPVWKLVRLWIAEGFIQEQQGMTLEDIAEEYLEDLVNRNLVMVGRFRSNGKIKTCRIHDMLHEFCKTEAAEENFFQEIKHSDQGTHSSTNLALEKYRRLCIHTRVLSYIASKPHGPRVRSFLCFSAEENILPVELNSHIPGSFMLLRVLDAKSLIFGRFPNDLTQLVHLRYIVLSSDFKVIPATLSCLWNIQTFVIETSHRTLDIRADIWKMIHLRHVKTNASTSLPSPLSKSRKSKDDALMIGSLQTLSMISPESCSEEVFARVPNLNVLGIRGQVSMLLENRSGSMLFDSLGKLSHLENLKLLNDVFPRPPSEGKLMTLPLSYKFPPKLKKLTLSDTLLDWKHMSILGRLDNLQILKLKDNAFEGDWWQPEDGGFRALRVLHIGRTKLETWNASAHHFPRLRHLFLKHCSHLEALPLGFAEISTLQLVDLYCTTRSAAESARKIQRKKQEGQNNGGTRFKLCIYPPEQ
ncbi:putative late blight resistance protein homolog R1A-10 [Andrographis paniculata]|uniref:putative late blight resistance protein homolog R1A-10 n=1 Tax=Andrographis paniculata TaxID=175694 RepID=UPI0021E84E67|nr:putative late blight resistance protein homolog R1A-10 [Andrographis paniculata]XP_051144792.1 putative late blight resistance protein homolog R1A-10 [Andrographis paniculata]XP_051144793.1 putative late blight resistance protein homolog R1A-10 [Andrographis paniculata]